MYVDEQLVSDLARQDVCNTSCTFKCFEVPVPVVCTSWRTVSVRKGSEVTVEVTTMAIFLFWQSIIRG